MTFVVCPNLAVDRVLAVDALRPGGLSRGHLLQQQAGGKGANVLRAVLALGGGGELAGFAAGHAGRLIGELAAAEGLPLRPLGAPGEARVSTVVLEDDGRVTRLFEYGPQIGGAEEQALLKTAAGRPAGPHEWAVVDGAAPPGASPGFYAALCRALRAAGHMVLVDATGEQLAGALRERPDLVKVNRTEACGAVGAPGSGCRDREADRPAAETAAGPAGGALEAEGLELCRRLIAAGAREAVVTLGPAGAAGLIGGRELLVGTPPVQAANTVGAGDCFAGALVAGLERGDAAEAALALAAGAAAASAAHTLTGHFDQGLARDLTAAATVVAPSE